MDFELNSEAGRHNGSLVSEMGRQMNMVFSAHFLVAWLYDNARESREPAQCVGITFVLFEEEMRSRHTLVVWKCLLKFVSGEKS